MSWAVGKDLGFSPSESLEGVEQVHDLKGVWWDPSVPVRGVTRWETGEASWGPDQGWW